MGRQGLMDDSGYHGFDECANYESCTDNFVAELLEPYDVTSIEELIEKVRAKAKEESEAEHKAMCENCIHKVNKADIDAIYNQALEDLSKKIKWQYTNYKSMPSIHLFLEIVEQLKK